MNVSIVIPTKNSHSDLCRLLRSINLYAPNCEVIIVDDFSTDGTSGIEEFFNVKLIQQSSSPGKARNIGVYHSKNQIIALLDADTEITKDWLPTIQSVMEHELICAGFSPDPSGKHLPRVSIFIDGQDITYPHCNIAYNKSIFNKVGTFREDMSCAEDCEFHYRCARSNIFISYHPQMKVYHYEKPTFLGFLKKSYRNGYGRYELERIHPDIKHSHQHGIRFSNLLRLSFGALGYLLGRFRKV
jgi:glycosyltransferase involved in cell wall biosynthesis